MNENGIIANEITVTQGDGGIDIQATYQHHLFLIQCKNTRRGININAVKQMESSCSRFSNYLGLLVYNINELTSSNFITRQARFWLKSSNFDIKVCSSNQLVDVIKNYSPNLEEGGVTMMDIHAELMEISGVTYKNVSIKKLFKK